MILNNIKSRRKDSGFTIVELLVVIVVIGILAAITIVSYTGVTARANTQANKTNANNVLKAALTVQAESSTNAFPATSATPLTALAALNAQSAKLAGITVSSATVTSTNPTYISYRVNGTGTGVCVGYWDSTIATPAPAYLYGGAATVDNGTTCT